MSISAQQRWWKKYDDDDDDRCYDGRAWQTYRKISSLIVNWGDEHDLVSRVFLKVVGHDSLNTFNTLYSGVVLQKSYIPQKQEDVDVKIQFFSGCALFLQKQR